MGEVSYQSVVSNKSAYSQVSSAETSTAITKRHHAC